MIAAAVLSAALIAQSAPPSAGDAALREGDFAAAARAYTAAWQADRHDADALFNLVQLALYDNRFVDAERWLDLARTAAPSDNRIVRYQGLIEMRTDPSIDEVSPHHGPAVVPFVQTDPLPIVRVRVNGHDASFLIDTGAPNLVLDSRFAASIGLATSAPQQGTFAGGRHATVLQSQVRRLDLGGWSLSDLPANVLPVRDLMGNARPIDGILGTALFAHFLTTLDYRKGALILRDPGDSASFEVGAQREGATIVPMWLVGDHFVFVRARAGNGPEGLFNVDTGGTFGVQLTKPAIDAAGITLDSDDTRTGVGGAGATAFVPFTTSVTIGGLTENGVSGVYTPQGNQYGIFPFDVTGTISHLFFRKSALTFDFRAMRLVIESS